MFKNMINSKNNKKDGKRKNNSKKMTNKIKNSKIGSNLHPNFQEKIKVIFNHNKINPFKTKKK